MLHLSTWREQTRQVSNQRPLCRGPPSTYPLRHPRSVPLKVIPFNKIYTLKIILQISCIKRRQKVPDRLPFSMSQPESVISRDSFLSCFLYYAGYVTLESWSGEQRKEVNRLYGKLALRLRLRQSNSC